MAVEVGEKVAEVGGKVVEVGKNISTIVWPYCVQYSIVVWNGSVSLWEKKGLPLWERRAVLWETPTALLGRFRRTNNQQPLLPILAIVQAAPSGEQNNI